MRHPLQSLMACAVGLFLTTLAVSSPGAERPNIILIMADDVGIEGLGCYGGISYATPRLDALAAGGIRFTHAYSQPLCTPTRVQLMTGKYNHRNWRSFGILDPGERTFGHAFHDAGYATAIIGKWQLQSYDPPDLPGAEQRRGTGMHAKDAGFDEYALFHALHTENKGSRYANPTMLEGKMGQAGELRTYRGRYGEDVWVEKILDFLDRHPDQPRFVYYPMALPHWPFEPTPDSDDWNPAQPPAADLRYAKDMIQYMDTAVGNLMDGLEQRGMSQDTIVLFYSDNGTHLKVTSKLSDGREIPGGKATTRQTGIHVPLIAHCPARFQPGICGDLVDASDFFPTLLDLAGIEPSGNGADRELDGISFAPQLRGESGPKRQHAFFWYDPRPGWDKERFHREVFAVNKQYKLYQTGRLLRLTQRPLEEVPVDPLLMTPRDQAAKQELMAYIQKNLAGVEEPPLLDAYGKPEHDFRYVPKSRAETNQICADLLATGKVVHYGDPDQTEHKLWIFNPLDLEPGELRPCVFFIHGGGWGGDPAMLASQAVYLQRRGYNTVSIHFRKPAGKVSPQDSLRDARRAYRWIVQHGAQHHIDTKKLVVSGGSAGGHLSLALCTIPLPDDPLVEQLPLGLVLLNPVIDLVDGWAGGRQKCEAFGIAPRDFSPAHHVRAGLPPTLVLSGSDDALITPEQLRRFARSMTSAGNQCEVRIYPDAGHGFFNYGREQNRFFYPTMWEFEAFLEQVLR